jgi:hypothetical protein
MEIAYTGGAGHLDGEGEEEMPIDPKKGGHSMTWELQLCQILS